MSGVTFGKQSATESDYGGKFSIWTKANGDANETERVIVTASGNVGVGALEPTARLVVYGN
jgi:uncharacterized surface anchored protein